jgi:uncharacterized protein YlaI
LAVCKKCLFEEKGMLSGQGFTDFKCALCGRIDTWHNTNTPKFCHECSVKLNMCQRCGDSLEEEKEEKNNEIPNSE